MVRTSQEFDSPRGLGKETNMILADTIAQQDSWLGWRMWTVYAGIVILVLVLARLWYVSRN